MINEYSFGIRNISGKSWLDFIGRCRQSSIFHHPAWLNTITDTYKFNFVYCVLLDGSDEIVAGIPLFEINNRKSYKIPFTDHCSVLSINDEALCIFIKELNILKSDIDSPKIEIRSLIPLPLEYHVDDRFVLHTIDLNKHPSELYKSFSSSAKRGIKKAQKADLLVREENGMNAVNIYYYLHLSTRRRQGIPVQPKKFFLNVWNNIIDRDLGRFLFVYKDCKPIAGAVFVYYKKRFVYKFGSSLSRYWNLRPNNLLFWNAVQLAYQDGYTQLDWGRTEQNNVGLRFFKEQWGSERSKLYYYYSEQQNPSILKTSALAIMKQIIKITPSFVCRALGEIFYKYSAT